MFHVVHRKAQNTPPGELKHSTREDAKQHKGNSKPPPGEQIRLTKLVSSLWTSWAKRSCGVGAERAVGMRPRRRHRIARGEAELAKQVARGRAAQVSPNSAFGASRLRSKKTVLPAAPFRRSDGKIRPTRTIHFVLPTLSFRATDFLTIPTDFFFSAYGVTRTNHTAPDPPDFRIFAAPPRSAAHSPRHSALYLAPIRPRGGSSRNSALCLAGRGCSIQSPIPAPQSPLSRLYGIIAFLWKTTAS